MPTAVAVALSSMIPVALATPALAPVAAAAAPAPAADVPAAAAAREDEEEGPPAEGDAWPAAASLLLPPSALLLLPPAAERFGLVVCRWREEKRAKRMARTKARAKPATALREVKRWERQEMKQGEEEQKEVQR